MPRMMSLMEYVWNAGVILCLLDVLDRNRVKATFFVVGMNAVNNLDVIKMIADGGHDLACHVWMYEDTVKMAKVDETERILRTRDAIRSTS